MLIKPESETKQLTNVKNSTVTFVNVHTHTEPFSQKYFAFFVCAVFYVNNIKHMHTYFWSALHELQCLDCFPQFDQQALATDSR